MSISIVSITTTMNTIITLINVSIIIITKICHNNNNISTLFFINFIIAIGISIVIKSL